MSRRCNRGAGKIARHLWFRLVRWSGFPDNVMPVQFVLNFLHLLNQMSVVTIHITRPMRNMVFTLWACGSRRDCRQCSRPLLAWCRRHRHCRARRRHVRRDRRRRWRVSSRWPGLIVIIVCRGQWPDGLTLTSDRWCDLCSRLCAGWFCTAGKTGFIK